MTHSLTPIPSSSSLEATAQSILAVALEFQACSAGFIVRGRGLEAVVVACHGVDGETVLEDPVILELLINHSNAWLQTRCALLAGAHVGSYARARVQPLSGHVFEGALVLLNESSCPLSSVIDSLQSSWSNALGTAALLDERSRDRDYGLLCRAELDARTEAGLGRSLMLLELEGELGQVEASDEEIGHAARFLRRYRPPRSEVFVFSRRVFALLLEDFNTRTLSKVKSDLETAFREHRRLGHLSLTFGAASRSQGSLYVLAARALAEAKATHSPKLIIKGGLEESSRSHRSRRGTGRTARFRSTVDSYYLLQTVSGQRRDENLDMLLETLLRSLSFTREEFLSALLVRFCRWLKADRGQYSRGPRGGDQKIEESRDRTGQECDSFKGSTLLAKAARVSGNCESAVANGRFFLVLPLRDGGHDFSLMFEGSLEFASLEVEEGIATSLIVGIESALELFRLRDRRSRDKQELKLLRESVDHWKSQSTGELVPIFRESAIPRKGRYDRIIGRSPAMSRVLKVLDRVTDSDVPVLVQGETGTGKELIARCLHENGPRSAEPFVTINCTALSETLMESELFGHTRGSFTGATEDKEGYFERADGGTLFLDEVQDMSPIMQRELLRVLQEGEIQRVGGKRLIKVDVRIVAATNRDLKSLVNERMFRQDLYYRLNVVLVSLPPLRQRREDLPELVEHFLSLLSKRYSIPKPRLEKEALELIIAHDWGGNIRELQNLLEKTLLMLEENVIRARDISFEGGEIRAEIVEKYFGQPYKEAKDHFQREYLRACLLRHSGHVTNASKEAGIVRSSFHKLMRKFDISTSDFSKQ